MKYIKYLIVVICALNFFDTKAQYRADEYYENLAYQEAITKYYKIVKKNPEDEEALFNLANAYRLNGESIKAEKWFRKAVKSSAKPDCRLYFAQMLLTNEKYEEAALWFRKYASIAPNLYDANSAKNIAKYCDRITKNGIESRNIIIVPVNFNSDKLDFSPTFWGEDKIIFASNRKESKKKDAWTADNYVDLFYVEKDSAANFTKVKSFSNNINSVFHEGPAAIDVKNNVMYVTRNDFIKKKRGYDGKKNTRLKIYKTTVENEEWSKLTALKFNSSEYSCCHPALSPDGKTMVFASDMPEGFGGMDLYITHWDGTEWSKPKNLGREINTAGEEIFPFIHEGGDLYFSSNMRIGIGGLDIFVAKRKDKDKWADPVNVGAPLNSPRDDFGLILRKDKKTGYFTSNRNGEHDDIYSFIDSEQKKGQEYICGKVINKKYNVPLADAVVNLYNKCSGEVSTVNTDLKGLFTFPMNMECEYAVVANKQNFIQNGHYFSTVDTSYSTECIEMTIPLIFKEEIIPKIAESEKIKVGDVFDFYNVYFDFDEYAIIKEASWDLDSLLNILRKHPDMKGELSAHTDSRGTYDYNIKLSENRAKSAKAYLVEHGIDPNRITTKGYGETRLKNECADGVECSELEHQLNRRVEFKVTYMGKIIESKEHVKYRTKPKTSNRKSL